MISIVNYPYKHFVKSPFLTNSEFVQMSASLDLLEWELYDKQAYIYWVCSLDFECPYYLMNKNILDYLISPEFLNYLSELFELLISKCVDATFHKMGKGHYSERHTDKNDNGEKIRIIIYFSEPSNYKGGELLIYENCGNFPVFQEHKFFSNSAFGFLMTEFSYHEVQKIADGERICLILTYI